jgi:hypothetical protein
MPLFMFHLLEWMDQPYKISVSAINARWAKKENIDDWCQLVIKYTEDDIKLVTDAPKSGIWKLQPNGEFTYDRLDTHRRAIEDENEAFFLRIARKDDYLYEGADMGILVLRGRLMTDDFELKDRAKKWIEALKGKYVAINPSEAQLQQVETEIGEIGGFKMM